MASDSNEMLGVRTDIHLLKLISSVVDLVGQGVEDIDKHIDIDIKFHSYNKHFQSILQEAKKLHAKGLDSSFAKLEILTTISNTETFQKNSSIFWLNKFASKIVKYDYDLSEKFSKSNFYVKQLLRYYIESLAKKILSNFEKPLEGSVLTEQQAKPLGIEIEDVEFVSISQIEKKISADDYPPSIFKTLISANVAQGNDRFKMLYSELKTLFKDNNQLNDFVDRYMTDMVNEYNIILRENIKERSIFMQKLNVVEALKCISAIASKTEKSTITSNKLYQLTSKFQELNSEYPAKIKKINEAISSLLDAYPDLTFYEIIKDLNDKPNDEYYEKLNDALGMHKSLFFSFINLFYTIETNTMRLFKQLKNDLTDSGDPDQQTPKHGMQ